MGLNPKILTLLPISNLSTKIIFNIKPLKNAKMSLKTEIYKVINKYGFIKKVHKPYVIFGMTRETFVFKERKIDIYQQNKSWYIILLYGTPIGVKPKIDILKDDDLTELDNILSNYSKTL